jgi:hypothetical protein
MDAARARAIAEEAYVFAFPMLMGYRAAFGMALYEKGPGYRGPLNALVSDARTLDHTFREVITPNADTPYSMAVVDLRAEPVVLSVPAVTDRYYVMQIEDLFGTNAHYVGTRATGRSAGSYVLAGPGWHGERPPGTEAVLPLETDLAFVIGRTQLLGADDVPALGAVQQGYGLQPLSAFLGVDPPPAAPHLDWPLWDDDASRDERSFAYLSFLLGLCRPTHPSEVELTARFATIGIAPGASFDVDGLEADAREALRAGVESARGAIAAKAERLGTTVNGWTAVDAFGDRGFYGDDYLLRAASAMAGWGGNDRVEASYPLTRVDGEGAPLDGAHRYRLRFESLPPARAFWSVTMYDTSYDGVAGYLVENPIGRYLVNSTTEGLVTGDDGSLTIHVQHDRPEDEHAPNWLPSPAGPFYLALRIYWPEAAALDGTWAPPPVDRVS